MSVSIQFNGKDVGLGKVSAAALLFVLLTGSTGAGLGVFLREQVARPASEHQIVELSARMGELGTHTAVMAERVGRLEESEKGLRELAGAVTALRVDLAATNRLLSETRDDLKDLRTRLSSR